MQKLEFSVDINATADKVWQVLFEKDNNGVWLAALDEGTTFEGTWAEGSIMKFLDDKNNGMYNLVEKYVLHRELKMKHLGWIVDGQLNPMNWENSYVRYLLVTNEDGTLIKGEINSLDEFVSFFESKYPKNFLNIKELAESV